MSLDAGVHMCEMRSQLFSLYSRLQRSTGRGVVFLLSEEKANNQGFACTKCTVRSSPVVKNSFHLFSWLRVFASAAGVCGELVRPKTLYLLRNTKSFSVNSQHVASSTELLGLHRRYSHFNRLFVQWVLRRFELRLLFYPLFLSYNHFNNKPIKSQWIRRATRTVFAKDVASRKALVCVERDAILTIATPTKGSASLPFEVSHFIIIKVLLLWIKSKNYFCRPLARSLFVSSM